MRVPTRVVIGGHKVKIEYVETIYDDDGHTSIFGESIDGDNHILISTSRSPSAAVVWQTLYHELMHVTLQISGATHILAELKGSEEAVVTGLDNLLGPLLNIREALPGSKWKEVEFDFEHE